MDCILRSNTIEWCDSRFDGSSSPMWECISIMYLARLISFWCYSCIAFNYFLPVTICWLSLFSWQHWFLRKEVSFSPRSQFNLCLSICLNHTPFHQLFAENAFASRASLCLGKQHSSVKSFLICPLLCECCMCLCVSALLLLVLFACTFWLFWVEPEKKREMESLMDMEKEDKVMAIMYEWIFKC